MLQLDIDKSLLIAIYVVCREKIGLCKGCVKMGLFGRLGKGFAYVGFVDGGGGTLGARA